jgi:hypothetical protein
MGNRHRAIFCLFCAEPMSGQNNIRHVVDGQQGGRGRSPCVRNYQSNPANLANPAKNPSSKPLTIMDIYDIFARQSIVRFTLVLCGF